MASEDAEARRIALGTSAVPKVQDLERDVVAALQVLASFAKACQRVKTSMMPVQQLYDQIEVARQTAQRHGIQPTSSDPVSTVLCGIANRLARNMGDGYNPTDLDRLLADAVDAGLVKR